LHFIFKANSGTVSRGVPCKFLHHDWSQWSGWSLTLALVKTPVSNY